MKSEQSNLWCWRTKVRDGTTRLFEDIRMNFLDPNVIKCKLCNNVHQEVLIHKPQECSAASFWTADPGYSWLFGFWFGVIPWDFLPCFTSTEGWDSSTSRWGYHFVCAASQMRSPEVPSCFFVHLDNPDFVILIDRPTCPNVFSN